APHKKQHDGGHHDRRHFSLQRIGRRSRRHQLQDHHRAHHQKRQDVDHVRLSRGQVRNPKKTCLAKIQRDRDRTIQRKQKRHLDQQRQTAAEWIAFLHEPQLVHLQLFHPGIVLLHPLHLLLQLFHLRRELLRFLHRLRRPPLQRKEERIDRDREENDRNAITAGELEEISNRTQNRNC